MKLDKHLLDQEMRQRALQFDRSFIVRAPAGSGKTELLTQRYLLLLAHAQRVPEEIIAITFTRKAAAEMRERILKIILDAHQDIKPKEPHRLITWQLAKAVLQRDHRLSWNLLNNPNRLCISTMDALAARICSKMPILSGLGAQAKIIENPSSYYQQAVERIILNASRDNTTRPWMETLLWHLDNRATQLQQLLMAMLAKREQWLPHVMSRRNNLEELQQYLQQGLQHIIVEKIVLADQLISVNQKNQLLPLLNFAAEQLKSVNPEHPLCNWQGRAQFAKPVAEEQEAWLGLSLLLLTQEGHWRKGIDKRCGFPANNKEKKAALLDILEKLAQNTQLQQLLFRIQQLPLGYYSQQQWNIITALIQLLPLVVAELNVIFQEQNCLDFIELNLAALRALGEVNDPTNLALYMDYKISHILVDEFQDTSVSQFHLLEKLTAGWCQGDGRTLFLVGDPMQSIYRFRNAEVSLFLRAQQQGLGNIQLDSLTLQLNFRSQQNIVEWVNQTFVGIFPEQAEIGNGAIPFTPATPAKSVINDQVHFYPLVNFSPEQEAQQIVKVIQQYYAQDPQQSIAILVRSRFHLLEILPCMRTNNIPFQAIEIENLSENQMIIDVFSLLRALAHLGDRIAWLAILRAPWCGLQLQDLHIIAENSSYSTIWSVLERWENLTELSNDAVQRLQRVVPVLSASLQQRGRLTLSDWLQGCWISLGGPACVSNNNDLININTFFQFLINLEQSQKSISMPFIQEKLAQLFAVDSNANATNPVQVMTIHKSKGLEFDHVIIPRIAAKTTQDTAQILLWLERLSQFGTNDLILAPIKASIDSQDSIYRYLQQENIDKLQLELARLLYVAVTRAKHSLHLFATIETDLNDPSILLSPARGSFLDFLWPQYEDKALQLIHPQYSIEENIKQVKPRRLRRLQTDYQLPLLVNGINPQPGGKSLLSKSAHQSLTIAHYEFNYHQQIGTVTHEMLYQIGRRGIRDRSTVSIDDLSSSVEARLKQLSVSEESVKYCQSQVMQALKNTLSDERGFWILQKHQDDHYEWALSGVMNDQILHAIIDRSFIDAEDIRWIIDYKITAPMMHDNIDVFMEQQREKYLLQLQQYAEMLKKIEQRSMRCALYFPIFCGWCEWEIEIPILE